MTDRDVLRALRAAKEADLRQPVEGMQAAEILRYMREALPEHRWEEAWRAFERYQQLLESARMLDEKLENKYKSLFRHLR